MSLALWLCPISLAEYESIPEEDPPESLESGENKDSTERDDATASKRVRRPRRDLLPVTESNKRDLARIFLKAGGNFASQSLEDIGVDGFGAEGAIGFSWDLAYQPVFLELELGYKLYFFTDADVKTNVIPLRFGTFYRMRTGRTSQWKVGIAPAIEARISQQTGLDSALIITPALSLAMIWEWGGFLVEPSFTLYSVGDANTFFASAVRAGYRF